MPFSPFRILERRSQSLPPASKGKESKNHLWNGELSLKPRGRNQNIFIAIQILMLYAVEAIDLKTR